jgi:myo-inositol-1(or 4)-monophosphatase
LDAAGGSPFRWVIDPLDGTSNYVHRFPFYAVSIALQHERELIAGVIYDPTRDELFAATRGGGARLNGEPISPSPAAALCEALVVVSLPVGIGADHPAVARMLKVLPAAQHIQRTGSAALNLAYVACGRIDAFWSTSLHPWDMAAGALIVAEAGGRVMRIDGGPLDIEVPSLLASNGSGVHGELQSLLTS